jgi:hypothetical protein
MSPELLNAMNQLENTIANLNLRVADGVALVKAFNAVQAALAKADVPKSPEVPS